MPNRAYDAEYRRRRAALLAGGAVCIWCGAEATTADHVPPLKAFAAGQWQGELLPACQRCNSGRRAERATMKKPTQRQRPLRRPRRRRGLF